MVAAGAGPHLRPGERPAGRLPVQQPRRRASGRGAILWLGGHAAAAAPPPTLDSASLHSDDTLVGAARDHAPRRRGRAARDRDDDARADRRHVRLAAGHGGSARRARATRLRSPTLARRPAGARSRPRRLHRRRRRRQHDRARAPARASSCARSATTRRSFEPPVTFSSAGAGPITALDGRHGLPRRHDRDVGAGRRWSTRAGSPTPASSTPSRLLGPAGYAPQLAAVLSDNNHAFVMWTDEPPPAPPPRRPIYLEHSGDNVTVRPAARAGLVRRAGGAAAHARLDRARCGCPPRRACSPHGPGCRGGNYAVSAAGLTSRGAGRHADARRSRAPTCASPRSPPGRTTTRRRARARAARVARLRRDPPGDPRRAHVPAARGGVSFERARPARAGGRSTASPSVAIDPATDRAVVAWQTRAPAACRPIAYAVRAAAVGAGASAQERADREQAEGEAADVRVVGDAGAAAERRRDAERAEQRVEDRATARASPTPAARRS